MDKKATETKCPICHAPVTPGEDEVVEFRSALGLPMHIACFEKVGGERALAIVAGALEGMRVGEPRRSQA